MAINGEIGVVLDNGVLRPERQLPLPEHTRLVIAIRRIEVTAQSEAWARAEFRRSREQGGIRLEGWRPTRDEVHERR
ncbi:MAG: DUF104 domain-containing protein [Phycisphaerales bacterium]|nr:MAG: DUF104 domain-containing protein [Phycisphaerales bacterium]